MCRPERVLEMMRARSCVLVLAITLTTPAYAYGGRFEPPMQGHVTDPPGKLSPQEKATLEDLLGSIQAETRVEVAAFIANVPAAQLDDVGKAAFARWGIGRKRDSGVLIAVCADASAARVILDPERP